MNTSFLLCISSMKRETGVRKTHSDNCMLIFPIAELLAMFQHPGPNAIYFEKKATIVQITL